MKHLFSRLGLLLLLAVASSAFAIDNPDLPDYVAEFEARAKPYESKIGQTGSGTIPAGQDYADFAKFLDTELNQAYSQLMKKLDPKRKEELKASQKSWITFRDSEGKFIQNNWNQAKNGSSYVLSVGAFRSSIVRDRVKALLQYLKD